MKLALLFSTLILLSASRESCSHIKKGLAPGYYRGRLEVKAACMNYTLSVVAGNIDPSLVEPSWTDETTGKTYKKAFALGNRCNFPNSLKAGDEFYFKIDSSASKSCIVCMIYYPVPSKKISITVIDSAAYQLVR
jgi:hypothetical protein